MMNSPRHFLFITAERCLAFFLLIFLSPLFLFVAVLVRLSSRGPILYCQERVGLGQKIFKIIKFRSMTQDAESHSGPVWAAHNDSRVTSIGRFLRRLHLDELPQVVNVLRGEMSFVGPRPERPHFVALLEKTFVHYHARHRVSPGITGLAQVRRESDTDLKDVRQKLLLDRVYIQKQSVSLDLVIVVATALRCLRNLRPQSNVRNFSPRKLDGLHRNPKRKLSAFKFGDHLGSDPRNEPEKELKVETEDVIGSA